MNPDHRGKRTFTLKFNWIFFSLIAIHNFCSHFNAREDQYFQTEAWLFLNHFASHSNINWVIPTVSIFCASDKVASQSDCNTYFVGDASIKLSCEWLPLDMPETAQSSPQCLIGPKQLNGLILLPLLMVMMSSGSDHPDMSALGVYSENSLKSFVGIF